MHSFHQHIFSNPSHCCPSVVEAPSIKKTQQKACSDSSSGDHEQLDQTPWQIIPYVLGRLVRTRIEIPCFPFVGKSHLGISREGVRITTGDLQQGESKSVIHPLFAAQSTHRQVFSQEHLNIHYSVKDSLVVNDSNVLQTFPNNVFLLCSHVAQKINQLCFFPTFSGGFIELKMTSASETWEHRHIHKTISRQVSHTKQSSNTQRHLLE